MRRRTPTDLAESFRDGVDEQIRGGDLCWLAPHDDRPCSGRLERFHFIGRQRVRNALGALLPHWGLTVGVPDYDKDALAELAEWDARNGGVACEYHHRRFDGHLTPSLKVPAASLPAHVLEFAEDWGLELEVERRFSSPELPVEQGVG